MARYLAFALILTASTGALPGCSGRSIPGEFAVMTFNIRYNNPNDGADAWPNRRDWVADILVSSETPIIGLQEALHDQVTFLDSTLLRHRQLGVGRDDGISAGEYSPLLVDTTRFAILQSGTFWLSEFPDSVGSVGWDAALPRISTWAILVDRTSGDSVAVFNSHFDHRGEKAREESAKLLRRKSFQMAGNLPIVLMGDFNTLETDPPYLAFIAHQPGIPDLQDSFSYGATTTSLLTGESAPDDNLSDTEQPEEGTFRSFDVGSTDSRRIDYVFATSQLAVQRYEVLAPVRAGRYPSDHLPVRVVYIPHPGWNQ